VIEQPLVVVLALTLFSWRRSLMPRCWCKYNKCNGADIHRNTKRDHGEQDRLAELRARLGVGSQPPRPPPPAPAPLPPRQAVSGDTHPPIPSSDAHDTSSASCRADTATSPPAASTPPAFDTQMHSPVASDREEAEERGQVHMDHHQSMEGSGENIGDLDEDPDASSDQDGSPVEQSLGQGLFGTSRETTSLTIHHRWCAGPPSA
jgi:hypothetical protein